MDQATELFAAIYFVVIGLSHLLQPAAWIVCFARLRALGRVGVFPEGLMSLAFGAFVVAFHPIWSGLPAVLSVVGVLQILKGALRLCLPDVGLRLYERMSASSAWALRGGGVIGIALGMLFGYIWLSY